jgi:polyisoprenoid-binding protein YceI
LHPRLFAAVLLAPFVAFTSIPHATPAQPSVWRIDPVHSGVSFRIRHFVTKVRGKFTDFRGTITADPDAWQNAVVEVEIRTASITTDNAKRDAHLRSSDFFAADSFPTLVFRSTRIERQGDAAKIYGTLTMRGVTRPVVLTGQFTGLMKSAQGDHVGFEATTTVNRMDYGIAWNRAMEGGGAMLGDDVEVEITVDAVRAPAPR